MRKNITTRLNRKIQFGLPALVLLVAASAILLSLARDGITWQLSALLGFVVACASVRRWGISSVLAVLSGCAVIACAPWPAIHHARECARLTPCRNALRQHSGCHASSALLDGSARISDLKVSECWICGRPDGQAVLFVGDYSQNVQMTRRELLALASVLGASPQHVASNSGE
jgi:hypothetical protein